MLEINGLETAYGQSQVLFGMELNVGKGEVVTLLGRNGMGKTTTLHSVMGLVPSRSGNIRFQGQELRVLPSYQIAKTGLSLVPEGRQIFPNLTVHENLVATASNRTQSEIPGTSTGSSTFSPGSRTGSTTWATSFPAGNSRCLQSAAR